MSAPEVEVGLGRDDRSTIAPIPFRDPPIPAGFINSHLEGHSDAGTITAANEPSTNLIRINARLSSSVE